VPIYATDSIVRRAPSLQLTADARPPLAHLSRDLWQRLGLAPGDAVRVTQGSAEAVLPAAIDATLAATAVRVAAGHPTTAGLGAMFGPIAVEKASAAMSTSVDERAATAALGSGTA
jgi:NADH-quinone oxidoreductase subunit G